MGYACCQSLPAISPSYRVGGRGKVFPHNESVEMASTSVTKAYRRRSAPDESLEPAGKCSFHSSNYGCISLKQDRLDLPRR